MLLAIAGMQIVYIFVATILLWISFYFATKWIISDNFASDKKLMLLLSALIMVILLVLVGGLISTILGWIGWPFTEIRNAIDGGGQNMVPQIAVLIVFLLFMVILRFMTKMNWEHTTWVSLIALILLYCVYSAIPELNFWTL